MAHMLKSMACALALLAPSAAYAHPSAPTPRTLAGLPLAETRGYGAKVPFDEYEAENADSNGRQIGPDRRFTTLAAEASGRRAVRLDGPHHFVEFILARPANALTVRYALPDGVDGQGRVAGLDVRVGGERLGTLATTSRHGWFYGRYPFTNTPADGQPHHVYDEARLLLPQTLPAGTRVRLTPSGDAPWTVVDLADFERVPPARRPPRGAVSILDFGGDPSGATDSAPALNRAIAAARAARKPVWLPPGTYRIPRHVLVDDVEIVGAGPWRSVLSGPGVGLYGRTDGQQSRRVVLRDFAILGEVTERIDDDQVNGVGGAMGDGSVIDNLWIQHTKVGLWFDGPMDGITIRNLRLLDLAADGLNFRRGVSHAVVENSFVRNAGDDGLAMWSHLDADHDNVFRRNTIVAPILANGVAIYGGRDLTVSGNLVADTLTQGGAFHIGNRFSAVPVAGTITLAHNLAVRSGSFDPNWKDGVGALWFFALDAPMTARIVVRGTRLVDSSYEAINFRGQAITGVAVKGVRIEGAGTHAVQLQSPGEAVFASVTATGLGKAGMRDCGSGFVVRDGGGNRGWAERACPP